MLRILQVSSYLLLAIIFSLVFCALIFGMDHQIGGFLAAWQWNYWASYLLYGLPLLLLLTLLNQVYHHTSGLWYGIALIILALVISAVLVILISPKPNIWGFLVMMLFINFYLGLYSGFLILIRKTTSSPSTTKPLV